MSGLFICILLSISACVKQTTYPDYPILTSLSVSQTSLNWYFAATSDDSIYVTLNFTDGEGGIGPVPMNSDPDTFPLNSVCNHAYDSLGISDPFYNIYWYKYHASHFSTDSCLYFIQSAYVPDNTHNPSLRGTIQFAPAVGCPPSGTVDTVIFSCFIKDRNGKISNHLRTPPIIITCQ